jgi:hypothetical protein
MLALLVALSLGYPGWLKSIAYFLDSFSLPFSVNTPCIAELGGIDRWQQGLFSFLILSATIAVLLFARPALACFCCIPHIRTRHFVNMQIIASILVTQSVAVLLPMAFSADELASEGVVATLAKNQYGGEEDNGDLGAAREVKLALNIVGSLVAVVVISTSAVMLVDHAHTKYLLIRKSFFENEGQELSQEEVVDQLLPFWSTFCLSYVPRSANFESKVIRHRVLCFVLPCLCKTATSLNVVTYAMEANNRYVPNVLLIGACFEALCFVLLNSLYLRQQLKRPYISPRLDTVHGDPLNNAEILTTRVISWGATLFCLRRVLAEKLNYELEWLVPCLAAALILALAFSQRSLFRGLVDTRSALGCLGGERSSASDDDAITRGNSPTIGNTELGDIGASRKIEEMLDCCDTIEMWRLQKSLEGPHLVDSEKPRWVIEELAEAKKGLTISKVMVGSTIGAIVLTFALVVVVGLLAPIERSPFMLVALVVGCTVTMEVYTALNLQSAGESDSVGVVVADSFEVEMTEDNNDAERANMENESADGVDGESKEIEVREDDNDAEGESEEKEMAEVETIEVLVVVEPKSNMAEL